MQFLFKVIISALFIASVSELSKRSTLTGAVLASLPLTSVLALTWLFVDTKNTEMVADLSLGIFWMVMPSLLFFIALYFLLHKSSNYWFSLTASSAITVGAYFIFGKLLEFFGVKL